MAENKVATEDKVVAEDNIVDEDDGVAEGKCKGVEVEVDSESRMVASRVFHGTFSLSNHFGPLVLTRRGP